MKRNGAKGEGRVRAPVNVSRPSGERGRAARNPTFARPQTRLPRPVRILRGSSINLAFQPAKRGYRGRVARAAGLRADVEKGRPRAAAPSVPPSFRAIRSRSLSRFRLNFRLIFTPSRTSAIRVFIFRRFTTAGGTRG